ncbi:UNVERIFIED_CONTAM: Major strawberry allergen Fra a 1-3 [Sesamum calycinum]|uniref:Major strawberry allergen Fra a 1-3 n=1 Tax=Sesamum calycinum TaxID=2727403 RepID=A0AAW2L7E0_9LAMI
MGAITYDIEIPSSIPAAKMFKAVVLDADTLIPKIMPQAIKSIEILEGDGGVGTVKIIHFSEGSPYKSAKHRVDATATPLLRVMLWPAFLNPSLIISRLCRLKMEDASARTGAFITQREMLRLLKRRSSKERRRQCRCSRPLRLTSKPIQMPENHHHYMFLFEYCHLFDLNILVIMNKLYLL